MKTWSCRDGSNLAQVLNRRIISAVVTSSQFKGGDTMSRIAALFTIVFFGVAGIAGSAWAQDIAPLGFKKAFDDDANARSPDSTPAAEAFLLRAYPETDIPTDASFATRSDWAALNAGAHSTGSWQLIGPSTATYPSVRHP